MSLDENSEGLFRKDHRDTSKDAAKSILTGPMRVKVMRAIVGTYSVGLTDEELVEVTGLSASSARPRRVELARSGWIKETGEKRAGTSGKLMTVWASTLDGLSALNDYEKRT